MSFRFPAGLYELVKATAARRREPMTRVVVRGVMREVGSPALEQEQPAPEAESGRLACPVVGCEFSAPSPKARCPRHNRRVC